MENDVIYEKIAEAWKNQRGIGSVLCLYPINVYELSLYIVRKMRERNPDCKAFIICDNYNHFNSCKHLFTTNNVKADILSYNFIRHEYKYNYDVCIYIGLKFMAENYVRLINQSKFRLILVNDNHLHSKIIAEINAKYPFIQQFISPNIGIEGRTRTPVEEYRVAIELNDEDRKQYDKYSEYITTTINIFGNLDNINKARMGDNNLGISSLEFCGRIARANGWNENINAEDEFNRRIDEMYNPLSIKERANVAYNIMRDRSLLLSDNKDKLEYLFDIVSKHRNKRIIIVSKRGEFAREVTKYLSNRYIAIGDYHDCIEPMTAIDIDGNIIRVKSGANKGKPKVIKHKAISTNNLNAFNKFGQLSQTEVENWRVSDYIANGCINVLSIKNSSSEELECTSDVVIFTSPMCLDWDKFIYRFNRVRFASKPIIIYKVYFNNTIESTLIDKIIPNDNYIIHNEEKNLVYDENSGNIVL